MKIIIAIILLCVIIYVLYGLIVPIKIRCRHCNSTNVRKDSYTPLTSCFTKEFTQKEIDLLEKGIGSVYYCSDCESYFYYHI